ncbi:MULTISPECIES: bifunctional 2-polyprenyl-6-hydroxyphenol methylase/3-demethylubiquinol 3-O-methyltransferase UbiG [unclassified Streptomyces]|uniref:class I SAM-dependent methyltransferase n=1 Tax=unclassified Streptomyces TaxID=2593676 RepID=UPI001BEB1D80|nr:MULTISPECIES: class I SAM-dependent methyltransferase [unclassified Streptomyces]MBT2406839.1 class I SAM-dependent methyltransferase [Streptomyces sp. ISL-21]MBT2613528.1 class I SAM-dependent methyltransferase [Streptomyces sp. ISL-87]
MPTLRLPDDEPHRQRQVAESFGTDARRYDRARPRYPAAMVERILAESPGRTDAPDIPDIPDVLDVGCGTGIVARQFQAAGCRVLGVEPDARMADVARQLGCEVDVAKFEDWDPAGRDFDAVVAGQAWHWIDPAAGAAKAARVLRPGGLLAPFWNAFQFPPDVAEAVVEVCRRVMPDAPVNFEVMTRGSLDGYRALFGKAADGIREVGGFSEPEQWQFDWEWSYTRDAWLDQMPTQGAFTRLPAASLTEVLEGVGAAIDAMGGRFTMRYATVVVAAARTGAG